MFDGRISIIRIYSKALSPQEIYQIYKYMRLNYLHWWQRLFFWLKMTWYILLRGDE